MLCRAFPHKNGASSRIALSIQLQRHSQLSGKCSEAVKKSDRLVVAEHFTCNPENMTIELLISISMNMFPVMKCSADCYKVAEHLQQKIILGGQDHTQKARALIHSSTANALKL